MKFTIRYSQQANADLAGSYEWGIERWGFEAAGRWLTSIDSRINVRLSVMPYACPLAPETIEFEYDVRQLIFGRYRVLFSIDGEDVRILRIRGPFNKDSKR